LVHTLKKVIQRNISLTRALSKLGYTSRAQAEQIILAGRVGINGKIMKNPSFRCSLDLDDITIDGQRVIRKEFTYIIMNKPVGIVTTRSDERGRHNVYDILDNVGRWIFPVGRLDKDTSGLLLFTNDNQLGERLTNPKSKVSKTYIVKLKKHISHEHLNLFRQGIILDGAKLLPAKVKLLSEKEIEMTIFEGKNRQIRRMCESLGYKVVSLIRIKIGSLELDNLKPGEWKYIRKSKVEKLR